MIRFGLDFDFIYKYAMENSITDISKHVSSAHDYMCNTFNCTSMLINHHLMLECSEEDYLIILLACPNAVAFSDQDDK